MKNRIVMLKDAKTICRILDTIVDKGDTLYLAIDFNTKYITTIRPKDIYEIMSFENMSDDKIVSCTDTIIRFGI